MKKTLMFVVIVAFMMGMSSPVALAQHGAGLRHSGDALPEQIISTDGDHMHAATPMSKDHSCEVPLERRRIIGTLDYGTAAGIGCFLLAALFLRAAYVTKKEK